MKLRHVVLGSVFFLVLSGFVGHTALSPTSVSPHLKFAVSHECVCPSETAYYFIVFNDGTESVAKVDKGFFNEKNNWATQEEYDELLRYRNEIRQPAAH